jgi:dephospho-CoA kinase
MAHQLPEADKAARSDVVYENTGTLEQLDSWAADLVARLT